MQAKIHIVIIKIKKNSVHEGIMLFLEMNLGTLIILFSKLHSFLQGIEKSAVMHIYFLQDFLILISISLC